MTMQTRFVITLLLGLLSAACTEESPQPQQSAAPPTLASPAEITESYSRPYANIEAITFAYGIYFLPSAPSDFEAILDRAIQNLENQFSRVEKLSDQPVGAEVMLVTIDDSAKDYPPPDAESLRYFGRGLTSAQISQVQDSEQAQVLVFQHPADHTVEGLRNANVLVEVMARESGGLIWDETTRELFTPEAWRASRIVSEHDAEVPEVLEHITIHAYPSGDYVRAITLGMSKFGLPDLVVEDFSWSNQRSMGNLINSVAQVLAEGQPFAVGDRFTLDLATIQHDSVRQSQTESILEGGRGVAEIELIEGFWEQGDPSNRIVELTFTAYPGPDRQARQDKLLTTLFGSKDEVQAVRHNELIEAASRAAREELPRLRKEFTAGLAPGEYILLKAPFAVPEGGREWMWVEVVRWTDESIEGVLKNEPFNIPSLHAGQMVTVDEGEVFDYIHRFPDGREEGNQTGVLIQQTQQ